MFLYIFLQINRHFNSSNYDFYFYFFIFFYSLLLLLHMHAELSVWETVQFRADADEGNYKRIHLLCIAANGSCLQ